MIARPEGGAKNETAGPPEARRYIRCAEGPASRWQASSGDRHADGLGAAPGAAAPRRIQKLHRKSSIWRPVRIKSGFFCCAGRRGPSACAARGDSHGRGVTRAWRAGPSPAGTARKIAITHLLIWRLCGARRRFAAAVRLAPFGASPAVRPTLFSAAIAGAVTRAWRAGPSPAGTARKDSQTAGLVLLPLCGGRLRFAGRRARWRDFV